MRVRLASTVLTLMYKVAAISGLVCPAATRSAMRRSVGVSVLSCPGASRARCAAASACQRGGAEAGEGGDRLVEGGGGVAALAGLALRGAEHEQAAAEFERQPPLAGLGDDRRDGRGRRRPGRAGRAAGRLRRGRW